MVVIVIPVR